MAERLSLPRATRILFFATLFCVTFEKIHWNLAGSVSVADFVTIGFLLAYVFERIERGDARFPRSSLVVVGFLTAFLLVYLIGFFNQDTVEAASQLGKGMIKF